MAKHDAKVDENGLPDFSKFVKEQIAFPPYWNPSEGAKIYFIPRMRDNADPEFPRYVCQALMDMQCHQGPVDDQEEVLVKKNDHFTLSTYAALPLEIYFGTAVLVTVVKKRKIQGGKRDLWLFELMVSPEDRVLLDKKRVAMELEAKKAAAAALASPAPAAE